MSGHDPSDGPEAAGLTLLEAVGSVLVSGALAFCAFSVLRPHRTMGATRSAHLERERRAVEIEQALSRGAARGALVTEEAGDAGGSDGRTAD